MLECTRYKNEHITHVHHYHIKLPCSYKKVTDYTFAVYVLEKFLKIYWRIVGNDNQTNRSPTNNELLTLKLKCLEKELEISNKKLTEYLETEYKKNENAQTDNGIWESNDAMNIEHKELNKRLAEAQENIGKDKQ